MKIEAPSFITKPAEVLLERYSNKRNLISDFGLTSTLIFLGTGVEGLITGNWGHVLVSVFGGPLSLLAKDGTEMIYDARQYMKRWQKREELLGELQHVVRLWEKAALTVPPDHFQLRLF